MSYGSLMARYSREHFSALYGDVIPARLQGWTRSWCVQYPDEGATYAGALPDLNSTLDTVLVPTSINDEIRHRERCYQFIEITSDQIIVSDEHNDWVEEINRSGARYWLCEVISPQNTDAHHPLPQTYVDTCLLGSIQTRGLTAAQAFIDQTLGWDGVWVNDRTLDQPIYPRSAPTTDSERLLIDQLLEDSGVLHYRIDG